MNFRLIALCLVWAVAMLTSAAVRAGNADQDMLRAANLHKGGDSPSAMVIWKRWADQGNADAAYNLAVIHQYADGVAANPQEALRWYRRAAELGDKAAHFYVGLMYQNGEGVKADAVEAHRWYTAVRRHHLHHDHTPQMLAWRQQAAAMLDARDRQEGAVTAMANSAQVLADLKARAGLNGPGRLMASAGTAPMFR
jgi:TPR repeat protein